MARTYWEQKPDKALEFLGVFKDGHVSKDPKSPQSRGRIIDIVEMDVAALEGKLALDGRPNPPLLVGLPTAITKRLDARMPAQVPWAQLEGFLK